jgi:hypothetical protein
MSNYTDDQLIAIQGVLDRVTSYQDGAPEGTIEDELRAGFADVDVEVPSEAIGKLAEAVVDASAVLG